MDQQAFRQLLSTSGVDGGSAGSSSSSSSNASLHNGEDRARMFGVAKKRRPIASAAVAATTDMRPRKLDRPSNQPQREADKGKQKSGSGTAYLDRAEARRQGKEDANEFHEVEALREDFEKRIAEANSEDERAKLREQMAFLGGDAKHSVLVKGLDFALLEQQRAKAAGRLDSGKDDEELEAAFGRADKGEADRKNTGQSNSKISSKFKPIAAKSIEDNEAEAPEYIWRDGKRMRKKKKKRKDEEEGSKTEDLQVPTSTATVDAELKVDRKPEKKAKVVKVIKNPKAIGKQPHDSSSKVPTDVALENADAESGQERLEGITRTGDEESKETKEDNAKVALEEEARSNAVNDDDDDEDIFADAGRWQGLDDDSDEDEEKDKIGAMKSSMIPGAGAGKRDWFARDLQRETEEEAEESELPGALNHIVANARAAHEAANVNEDQREEEEQQSGRLQGFSNSKLDSQTARLLLERDQEDAAEEDGKKKKGGGKKRKKNKKDVNGSEDDDED